jgi:methionine-rich copper-binding protein CopC
MTLAMGASVIFSGNATAHPKITKSEPAAGAVLETAPKTIQLTFSEPLEPAFSTIVLKRVDGTTVATEAAKIDPAAPGVLVLQAPVLSKGEYQALFAVIGKDGHRREGDIKFTVK